ncbi:MAG TPA: beta-ketoacyl synthase chain length factor [Lentisphaeria bacterium]|nr:beta-ketoacyl synthase chain length factor [Lentisphaerota bacterium]HPY90836.1 beta-ketoacyl synthase chain length factor [Lentisphaeria bacterium]
MFIGNFVAYSDQALPGFELLTPELLKRTRERATLRRADRYTTLIVSAALALLGDDAADDGLALITATAFGTHRTTFSTLDDILDFPEAQILPTRFSHSVHNAAAAYVGAALKMRGPAIALAGFEQVLCEALELAKTFLHGGLCTRAMVIAAEEKALLTEKAHELWPERFAADMPEGVVGFLLSLSPQDNRRGRLLLNRSARVSLSSPFTFGGDAKLFQAFAHADATSEHHL